MNEAVIREVTNDDLPFVYSTWLRSYRYNSQFARKLTNKVYYEWHHKAIERILARGATCSIICDEHDRNVVFGYLVWELAGPHAIIHFAYVKKAFRNLGLMNQLLQASGKTFNMFSHYTEFCDEYAKRHELVYCPYVI
jgi:hypothetical protein